MNSTTTDHEFEIAVADPDRFLDILEQAIYEPDSNVRYEPDIKEVGWVAPVDRELLNLFPDSTLEYWIYVDNPKVAYIRSVTGGGDYKEDFVIYPKNSPWQTNKPLIVLRIPKGYYLYHLSLVPIVTGTSGPSLSINQLTYRFLERDVNTQYRDNGIAKDWANLPVLDAIRFNLYQTVTGIAVTSKYITWLEPLYNLLLDKIGVQRENALSPTGQAVQKVQVGQQDIASANEQSGNEPPWDRLSTKPRWNKEDWIYLFTYLVTEVAGVNITPNFPEIEKMIESHCRSRKDANYIKKKYYEVYYPTKGNK